nr:PTS sugar transporter subunit IIA [uncultured Mediterraneibacter sp.]
MIWEELDKSVIVPDLEAETWEDVMKSLGQKLIDEGYTKESYIDALLTREKDFPTGLDIDGLGVAIPHTDVSHVNKAGIAIGVLKKPVTFIQMGSDDEEIGVKLVFMLAVTDPNAHIDELQRIIEIIQDKDVLEKLFTVTDKDTIIEVIKEKENLL